MTAKPDWLCPGAGPKYGQLPGIGAPEPAVLRNDLDPLILDLLEWIGREPRSYADVIDPWRTSCPRLTVWEDAMDRGFAAREHGRIDAQSVARMERSKIRGRSTGVPPKSETREIRDSSLTEDGCPINH